MDIFKKLNKHKMIDSSGCWIWTGDIMPSGYGRVSHNGRKTLVHRMSAHLYLGFSLDSDLQINHKRECQHKACFNPEHLYVGTPKQNSEDYSASKTHCINGHELTSSNTYVTILRYGPRKGSTVKNCRECGRLNVRRRRKEETQ